ncbi:transcriptional regulator with XRE-family HTH domain [Rhizobium pisi]
MHDRVAKRFASSSEGRVFRAEGESNQATHVVDIRLGQQHRIRRVHSNLSQTELGQKVGLSYQPVQKYESCKNRISASMLYEIASGLNVPVGCFFDGLPQPGSGEGATIAPEADERIAISPHRGIVSPPDQETFRFRPERRDCGRASFGSISANSSETRTDKTFANASKVATVTFSLPLSTRPT